MVGLLHQPLYRRDAYPRPQRRARRRLRLRASPPPRASPATAPSSPSNGLSPAFPEPSSPASSSTPSPLRHQQHARLRHRAAQGGRHDFASTAERQFSTCREPSASLSSTHIDLVELPADCRLRHLGTRDRSHRRRSHHRAQDLSRLLSNTLAHQWWGGQISPATLNDAWITNGMSRYAELMYVEDSAGKTAFESAITDVSGRSPRLRHRTPDDPRPPRSVLSAVPVDDP